MCMGTGTERAETVLARDPQRAAPLRWRSEFVALAEDLAMPLVTSDRAVLEAFATIAMTPEAFAGRMGGR